MDITFIITLIWSIVMSYRKKEKSDGLFVKLELWHKSTYIRCGKCAKCQIFGTFATPNIKKKPSLSDVPNAIIFVTCYSILTYLPLYGQMWQMLLLFFYSSFSLISSSVSISHPNPLLQTPTLTALPC